MDPIERIYREWDEHLSNSNAEGLVALYAPDATLESPLVPHLLKTEHGIVRGSGELQRFFEILAQRKPEVRRHYRTGYLTDGRIKRQRVYWGWFGVRVLQTDAYHR